MIKKLPIVVLRSNDNCFLDILRACGSADIPTIPVVFTWEGADEWISEQSQYYVNPRIITNPVQNEEKARQDLLEIGKELFETYHEKLLIIASSDTNLYFLQKYFNEFSEFFLQMGHGEFEEDCICELRKDSSAELLEKGNVDIPLTIAVREKKDIEYAVNNITYPCVYKPVIKDLASSFQNTHNKKKAIECDTKEELLTRLEEEVNNKYELIVQEKIEFDSLEDEVSCYVYSDKKGEILLLSGQHKILEHPHPYGTGVISQPYIDSEMEEIARKIVKAYNWRGFLGIEFMRNKKSGKWVVIEINLRPWISVNFQAMLGFNYIAALYNDMYGINESAPKVMTSESFDVLRVNMKMLVKKELAEHDNEEAAFDEIINILKKSSGKIIFSYYIQGDPKPGETEKQYLLNQYPNQKEKIEYIYELIKENNDIFESKKCR